MDKREEKACEFTCKITKETIIAALSVLVMWAGYYIDSHKIFGNSIVWSLVWGFGIMIGLDVLLPAWWILIKKHEGLAGMGITKKNLGMSLIFSIGLGGIRLNELINVSKGIPIGTILPSLLYNLLSIWEVCFMYSWLFTRFKKAFGRWIAALLTALSVGAYHTGTLSTEKVLILMGFIFLCALCFAVTENIFTLWPVYWVIGCSSSVIKAFGSDAFPWEMVGLMAFMLLLHILGIYLIAHKAKKIKTDQEVLEIIR